jgi:hypothetical protein
MTLRSIKEYKNVVIRQNGSIYYKIVVSCQQNNGICLSRLGFSLKIDLVESGFIFLPRCAIVMPRFYICVSSARFILALARKGEKN